MKLDASGTVSVLPRSFPISQVPNSSLFPNLPLNVPQLDVAVYVVTEHVCGGIPFSHLFPHKLHCVETPQFLSNRVC